MSFLIPVLLTVHIFVCLLLVLVILMQLPRSEGLGAAFGGGVTENIFGAQTTNVLAKFTVWLGVAFFVITLMLAIAYTHKNTGKSAIQRALLAEPVPAASASASPEAAPGATPLLNLVPPTPAEPVSSEASPVASPAAVHTP